MFWRCPLGAIPSICPICIRHWRWLAVGRSTLWTPRRSLRSRCLTTDAASAALLPTLGRSVNGAYVNWVLRSGTFTATRAYHCDGPALNRTNPQRRNSTHVVSPAWQIRAPGGRIALRIRRGVGAQRRGVSPRAEPFSCARTGRLGALPGNRQVLGHSPARRELIIPFGATGYVALYEIANASTVIVLTVRHQREEDYHRLGSKARNAQREETRPIRVGSTRTV